MSGDLPDVGDLVTMVMMAAAFLMKGQIRIVRLIEDRFDEYVQEQQVLLGFERFELKDEPVCSVLRLVPETVA